MNTTALLAKLRHLGVKLWIEDGKLRFSAPKGVLTTQLKAEMAEHKEHIISFLSNASSDREHSMPPLQKADRRGPLPLSFAQNRMWFLNQLAPGSAYYNIPSALFLRGLLDIDVLEQVFLEIVRRHEVLRTVYKNEDGHIQQVIKDPPSKILTFEDCSCVEEETRQELVERTIKEESSKSFDLTRDLMLRVKALRLDADKHVVVFNMHHIASDGWSFGILLKELSELYAAFSQEKEHSLPELSFQYVDYAVWQRSALSNENIEKHLSYWKDQLKDVSSLELPADKPRSNKTDNTGGKHTFHIDEETSYAVRTFAKENGLTPFMVTLGAYQVLLAKYTGQDTFCVGTPIAGRQLKQLENLIGFFVNSLPLKNIYNENLRAGEFWKQLKSTCLEAFAHQDLPFDLLVDKLQIKRDLTQNPIFQTLFSYQAERGQKFTAPSLVIEPLDTGAQQAKFDIALVVTDFSTNFVCRFEYNASLFELESIEHLADCYATILKNLVSDPGLQDKELKHLEIVKEEDKDKLINAFAVNPAPFDESALFIDFFENSVSAFPHKTAVLDGDTSLTYQQLHLRSSSLAEHLFLSGAMPGNRIAMVLPRSIDAVVAFVAILKARCVYVPIDPLAPSQRIARILEDCAAPVLVSHRQLMHEKLSQAPKTLGNIPHIYLDRFQFDEDRAPAPIGDNQPKSAPDDDAYILYTSGSTGTPKGVRISHRSLAHFVQSFCKFIGLCADDRMAQSASLSFDVSVAEISAPLFAGGSISVYKQEDIFNLDALAAHLDETEVTIASASPLVFKELLQRGPYKSLRHLISAGDTLKPEYLQEAVDGLTLWNLYGPTETTVYCSGYRLDETSNKAQTVPIGRPLPNIELYVLDAHRKPRPIGFPGELYVGGPAVSSGYLSRPELTKQKFVENPFSPSRRIYATGDLVKWRSDGNLVFFGRIDRQVQLRGYRIELGEIESRLLQHENVKECAATIKESPHGEQHIVAYIVPTIIEPDPAEIQSFVAEQLPKYMVPSLIVSLPSLPLTRSGKIDEKALPSPHFKALASNGVFTRPTSETQERLLQIWQSILHLDEISIDADFFSIGGHSLLATQVISHIHRDLGVDLPLRKIFELPTIEGLALEIDKTERRDSIPPLRTILRNEPLDLSFAQSRMWFLNQLAPNSSFYNIPAALRLRGALDVKTLERALIEIVRRHEIIRTVYKTLDGRLQQIIQSPPSKLLQQEDLSSVSGDEQPRIIKQRIQEESQKPFDLSKDLMLRAKVLKMNPEDHVLILVMHHISSDGWSMEIFAKETAALYAAFAKNTAAELLNLEYQYADYAAWQREYLGREKIEEGISYWKQELKGSSDLELSADHPRRSSRDRRADKHIFQIDPKLSGKVRDYAKDNGLTTFMVTLGIYELLLARYTGQSDFCVGVPVAGRQTAQLEPLIGLFVNSLPMRARYDGTQNAEQYFQQVKHSCLEAFAHQNIPFDLLVEKLQLQRDLSKNPVFQTMFSFQAERRSQFTIDNLKIEPLASSTGQAKFDLLLNVTETKDGLRCSFEYDADLFKRETIEYIERCYLQLLKTTLTRPQTQLQHLRLLDESTLNKVVHDWNATDFNFPNTASVVDLFQRLAQSHPEKIAVLFEDGSLSYRQLDESSNRLARYLINKGISLHSLIGISTDRSLDSIIGILAILKAGCSYIPLDPSYPLERLAFMVDDSQLCAVVTSRANKHLFQTSPGIEIICVDEERDQIERQGSSPPPLRVTHPESSAYVIYTSGSTGRPKGTLISHRGLVNLVFSLQKNLDISSKTKFLQFASLNFDASVLEIFPTICSGGTVVMATQETLMEPDSLADLCRRASVNAALLPPSFLPRLQPRDLPTLETLLVGGDACPENLAKLWSAERRLFNAYGPTECTVVATMTRCEGNLMPPVIGRPLHNLRAYVLDTDMEPLPPGAVGELYVGGVSLATGYLRKPKLTAEKFVPDPFVEEPGSRMYRTGDLARLRPDGQIEFFGRTDDQVKIRGHRIELGEIESRLLTHPKIEQSAVLARTDRHGDKYLAAYIVTGDHDLAPAEVKAFLETSLPGYMVPSFVLRLDTLPLTRNKKIDRKALPEPDLDALAAEGDCAEPTTETEKRLEKLWRELLRLDKVSTNADFFSIGGHSLLAATAVSLIKKEFGVDLKLIDFFKNASIKALAHIVDASSQASQIAIIKRTDERPHYPCTSAQKRMYILSSLDENGLGYNIPVAVRIKGALDAERLQEVFKKLAARHEAMRTHFHMKNGELVQVIDETVQNDIQVIDTEEDSVPQELKAFFRPFDLSASPLWRVAVFRMSPSEQVLAIDAHHIVLDGVSLLSLVREFGAIYNGQDPPMPALRQKDFAVWQAEDYLLSSGKDDEKYWLDRFDGELPVLDMPTDFPRPSVQSFRGRTYVTPLGKDLTNKLKNLAGDLNSTLFFTLLGIYKVLLHKYTGQEDIVVGIPVAGRPHHDLDATVGMFVSTLAIRSRPRPDLDASGYLEQVKDDSLQSIEHQLYPLETLIEKLKLERDTSRNPLFCTIFSMLDTGESKLSMGDLKLSPYTLKKTVSKFDLSLSAHERDGELHLAAEYCSDLFKEETIQRICDSFRVLCEGICDAPKAPIRDIDVLSLTDKNLLLNDFGTNPRPYDQTKLFIDFFKDSVHNFPDAIAIIDGDQTLTYKELDRRSDSLAFSLFQKGTQPGDRVAVILRRSAGAIIAFLAILKARCVYVPMDPFAPPQRIATILSDCEPKLLFFDSNLKGLLQESLPQILENRIVYLNECSLDDPPSDHFIRGLGRTALEDDAYIIYTSGSTGTPKGTRVPNSSLAHYVQAYCDFLGFTRRDRIINLSSLSFDASLEEIAAPLFAGGSIVVFPQEEVFDIEVLVNSINTNEVTVAAPSPLLAAQLVRRGPYKSLRLLTPGGDALIAEHIQGIEDDVCIWNLYGPTETTVSSCGYRVPPSRPKQGPIPIGRPFPNYEVYVLDKYQKLLPIGVPGELYIAGPGLSSGYLNRPALTAEKFVPNPFKPGSRMYATGDLVKWSTGGDLMFLGRIDRQVQIRGFRVELQEIEAVIKKLPGIENCLVLDIEASNGMKQLICYYTSQGDIAAQLIRKTISNTLPKYMIPDHFVHLEQFPLNAAGKIDIHKLPEADPADSPKMASLLPRTGIEAEVHALWQKILNFKSLNIDDNFFDVGGNSLRLIQLHEEINSHFHASLRLIDLFNNSTIEKMSHLLQDTSQSVVKKLLPSNALPESFFHSSATGISTPNILRATTTDIDLAALLSQQKQREPGVSLVHIYLGIMLHLLREYSGSAQSSAHFLDPDGEVTTADIDLSAAEDFPALFGLIAQQQESVSLDRIGTMKADDRRAFRPLFTSKENLLEGQSKLLGIFDLVIGIDSLASPRELLCAYDEAQLSSNKIKSLFKNYVNFLRMLVDEQKKGSNK